MIAGRAALRVVPDMSDYLHLFPTDSVPSMVLSVFQANAVAWFASSWTIRGGEVLAAARVAAAPTNGTDSMLAISAINAAHTAAAVFADRSSSATTEAIRAAASTHSVTTAKYAAGAVGNAQVDISAVWDEVAAACRMGGPFRTACWSGNSRARQKLAGSRPCHKILSRSAWVGI